MTTSKPDYRNDMTSEAVAVRNHYANIGRAIGANLIVQIAASVAKVQREVGVDIDPYLQRIIYLNVAQVVENEGRGIGGIDFGKRDNELEGRKE